MEQQRQRSDRQEAATQMLTLWTVMNSQKGQAWKTAYDALACDVLFFHCQQNNQETIQLAIVDAGGYVVLQKEADMGEWLLLWGAVQGLLNRRWVMVWDREFIHYQLRYLGVDEKSIPEMTCLQTLYRTVIKRKILTIDNALERENIHRDFSGSPAAVHAQQMLELVEHMAGEWEQMSEMRDHLKMG